MSAEAGQPTNTLADFGGGDLRGMDETKLAKFAASFQAATGDTVETNWNSAKPWLVQRFKGGTASWLVLFVYPGLEIPDVSFVEAHLFDKEWRRVAKTEFPTGYRMFIKETKVIREPALGSDVFVVKTVSAGPFIVTQSGKKPAFEPGDFQLQHYAATGTNLHLVRISDEKGRVVRNSYRSEVPFKGPPVPKRTADEWVQALASTNAVEALASLVWLTGVHLPSDETRQPDVNQESVTDSKLFEEVVGASKTKQMLKQQAASPNPWIREYGVLALRQPRED